MACKRTNLYKRCFFVLSGISNTMGKTLSIEMCRRFKPGSVAVLIENTEESIQEVKKEICFLENNIEVICCVIGSWETVDCKIIRKYLFDILASYDDNAFELAFILHNEGTSATRTLMEPQDTVLWKSYVQENLYSTVSLNQAFLQCLELNHRIEKLVINITSSLPVKPFMYNNLASSCKKARDMYFRALANEEISKDVVVLSYSPGIFESHAPEFDMNNNKVDLFDMDIDEKILKLPRVTPIQSALKLINILEEMAFISGHLLDYHDTYVL